MGLTRPSSLPVTRAFLPVTLAFLTVTLAFLTVTLLFLTVTLAFLTVTRTFLTVPLAFLPVKLAFLTVTLLFLTVTLAFLTVARARDACISNRVACISNRDACIPNVKARHGEVRVPPPPALAWEGLWVLRTSNPPRAPPPLRPSGLSGRPQRRLTPPRLLGGVGFGKTGTPPLSPTTMAFRGGNPAHPTLRAKRERSFLLMLFFVCVFSAFDL